MQTLKPFCAHNTHNTLTAACQTPVAALCAGFEIDAALSVQPVDRVGFCGARGQLRGHTAARPEARLARWGVARTTASSGIMAATSAGVDREVLRMQLQQAVAVAEQARAGAEQNDTLASRDQQQNDAAAVAAASSVMPLGGHLGDVSAAASISSPRCRHRSLRVSCPTCLFGPPPQKLSFINAHKLAGTRPLLPPSGMGDPLALRPTTASSSSAASTSSSSSGARWMQPSGACWRDRGTWEMAGRRPGLFELRSAAPGCAGPRRPGEGTENEEQGIISAEASAAGSVTLRITLLAAGFIIGAQPVCVRRLACTPAAHTACLSTAARLTGPAGSSVREIMRVTGCDIKSWTDHVGRGGLHGHRSRSTRTCRVFLIEGEDEAVVAAIDIITAAVDRYKELCEGRCQGERPLRAPQHTCTLAYGFQWPA